MSAGNELQESGFRYQAGASGQLYPALGLATPRPFCVLALIRHASWSLVFPICASICPFFLHSCFVCFVQAFWMMLLVSLEVPLLCFHRIAFLYFSLMRALLEYDPLCLSFGFFAFLSRLENGCGGTLGAAHISDSEIVMVNECFMDDGPCVNHAGKAVNHVLWLTGLLGRWLTEPC